MLKMEECIEASVTAEEPVQQHLNNSEEIYDVYNDVNGFAESVDQEETTAEIENSVSEIEAIEESLGGEEYIIPSEELQLDASANSELHLEASANSELHLDASVNSEAPSPTENLPECRTKRSYVCGYCNLKTLNPREYLYHLKDDHGELLRIFECELCLYASKSMQKLSRHKQMVHKIPYEVKKKYNKVKDNGFTDSVKSFKDKVKDSPDPFKSFKAGIASLKNARESKSPRRFQEYEFTDDVIDSEQDSPVAGEKTDARVYSCMSCSFVAQGPKSLSHHEAKCSLIKKIYKCSTEGCGFATHLKTKYNKHIKYHKLPVVKCDYCEFSTPYKWNLDRHLKNHSRHGNHGLLKCHLCNFKAQIKQSLTVHIANHHSSQNSKDMMDSTESMTPEEIEMLRMERDEDPEALEMMSSNEKFTVSNIEMGSADNSDQGEIEQYGIRNDIVDEATPKGKKPKIKMTLKKMKSGSGSQEGERRNYNDDFVHPDDVVHRHGSLYIKTEKCKYCPFKAAFQSELNRHMRKNHAEKEYIRATKKFKHAESLSEFHETNNISAHLQPVLNGDDSGADLGESPEDKEKKKSFFDKLQEKLTMNSVENLVCQFCGHESKCLSESVRHQKLHLSAKNIYASASLSTRCQFCRHRCKTTDDLVNHLKSCPEARKNQIVEDEQKAEKKATNPEVEDKQHPMENRVFVWNSLPGMAENGNDKGEEQKLGSSESTTPEDTVDINDYPEEMELSPKSVKKVYRCPHCSFWSSTPSRFHVHIVGHFNKKPYTCSECGYKSNWPWDITKHIKLKLTRKDHGKDAQMLITNTVMERNYEKYEKYISLISVDSDSANRTEGGLPPTKRKRLKRIVEEDSDSDSPKSSPYSKSSAKLPLQPKLIRGPKKIKSTNPSDIVVAGAAVHTGHKSDKNKFSMKSPSLSAVGSNAQQESESVKSMEDVQEKLEGNKLESYQTPQQDGINSSLETLQILASGSTNLAFLKNLQNIISENEKNEEATRANLEISPQKSDIMELVLDHKGNPEWKCTSCEFRDNEQETVGQHVNLAHSKKGPVSLLHAVHRCSVCGFAAGTKRHVQLHIETSHNGQGGIVSKSEGQSDPDKKEEKTYACRMCPYTTKKQFELKKHLGHHSPKVDCLFKCVLCPYYVATKNELFEHLSIHDTSNSFAENAKESKEKEFSQQNDRNQRDFYCDLCPFEAKSRAKLIHHRQFHTPRGLPYRCTQCSYNVTRQHLLNQHLRLHGIIPPEDSEEQNGTVSLTGRKSPCPSLTITPISSMAKDPNKKTINPSSLPTLSDELTKNLPDIPLVWVSRDSKFFKMFKCRQCPHVNLRKTNIQEHEKRHRSSSLPPGIGHTCQFCSYMCVNAGVMTSHLKVHSGSLGTCHAIVDPALAHEEQLLMLSNASQFNERAKSDEKRLHYCQHCPARFFFEKEIIIHSRFHSSNFDNQCEKCSFRVRDPHQILAHVKVHTPEYQEHTRNLMTMHPSAPSHPPTPGNSVSVETFHAVNSDSSKHNGIVLNNVADHNKSSELHQPPPTNRFKCDKCPSNFSKMITLQYHVSLHSADNPFKCTKCTYAAKTQIGLDQHNALHDEEEKKQAAKAEESEKATAISIQEALKLLTDPSRNNSLPSISNEISQPPIKLKFIGLRDELSKPSAKNNFQYYIEEQVPLSGIDLLKRKTQIEQELPKDPFKVPQIDCLKSLKGIKFSARMEDRIGNPKFHYPLHIDKVTGKAKDKRYKCSMCPSAFEKLDQFNVHVNLHGSDFKYKCRICDYSVKFFANFMMHSKRHKYHERMDAHAKGLAAPDEEDPKFSPTIGDHVHRSPKASKTPPVSNKENQYDFEMTPDMTTTEKQHIILQQKKGDVLIKEEEVDKKAFYCQHCPYSNARRDAVDSHSVRHEENNPKALYFCNFCDYTAAQPNFIREHTKVHFRPFKYVQPAGYMRHDKFELSSICSADAVESGQSCKRTIVSYEDGVFAPPIKKLKIVLNGALPKIESNEEEETDIEMKEQPLEDEPMVKSDDIQEKSEDDIVEKLEDIILDKPEYDIQEKTEDDIQEKPEADIQEKPEDDIQEKPEDDIQEKPEDDIQEKPEDDIQENPEVKIEEKEEEVLVDCKEKNGICIDFRSGDVVDAPAHMK